MAVPAKVPVGVRAEFGLWLKELRKTRGWSQERAADEIGVTRQQLMRWEAGLSGTSWESIPGIARTYRITQEEVATRAGIGVITETIDEARELEMILAGIPKEKRHSFLRTVRTMAEMIAA